MRRRAPGAGNDRELKVMALLAEEGWLCASRRHIGGAGDVLAIRFDEGYEPGAVIEVVEWPPIVVPLVRALLIEVKSTAYGPYDSFGPAERAELVRTAERYGAEPWLYWWPARRGLHRIPGAAFPPNAKRPAL